MDLEKHSMEPIDMKEFVDRMAQRDEFVLAIEKKHYEQLYKEMEEDEEELPISLKYDGTPELLNVFNYNVLAEVKPLFTEEVEGKITKENFKKMLDTYAGRLNLTDIQFERIFHMIDLDLDDKISWPEFLGFLEQELNEREIMANGLPPDNSDLPITGLPKFLTNKHGHIISSIAFWPAVTQDKKPDYSAGRYVTTSKDGYVDFWDLDMNHLYSGNAFSVIPLKITSTCITKIVAMADLNMFAVCTMDREIRIYDAVGDGFRIRTVIEEFRHGLVTMEYHFYDTDSIKSWIALGDTQGNIFVLLFSQNAGRTLFSQVIGIPYVKIRYSQISLGVMRGLHSMDYPKVHPTWIESMTYYDELKCLVTTCNSPTSAVVLINIFSSSILVKVNVAPGVTCGAILSRKCEEPMIRTGGNSLKTKSNYRFSHLYVTGGYDMELRIWDLDSPSKPKTIIRGRYARNIAILVDEDNHAEPWIYAFAAECRICVYDARTGACLQVYKERLDRFGALSQVTMCYNPYFKVLVIAAFKICFLKIAKTFNKDYTSGFCHEREVTIALYNYLYDAIVTCGADSTITKWDALKGIKLCSWINAHSDEDLTGTTVCYGITDATFDPNQSLLATGATNGIVKVWNFHTGTCLRKMELSDGAVLKLIWLKTRMFGIGFESGYMEWEPSFKGVTVKELPKKWHRTITAACFVPPITIIVGDIFGELLFCNYSSGKVYKRFYVHEPFRDLTMDADYEAQQRSTRNFVFDKRRHYNVGGVATTTIHCIFYLKKRPQEVKEGSILVSLDTGLIQLWSAHPKGALVASFCAIHQSNDFVVRMQADYNNDHLFTGSQDGYLKLWLLKNFATSERSEVSMAKLRLKYAFLEKTRWKWRAQRGVAGQSLPILLNSYRAHGMAITSIIFIDFCKLVITSACDRTVRYWSMSGQFLNQLGSVIPWENVDPTRVIEVKKLRLPPDLKRVMSSITMKVLTNGYRLTEEGERELVPTNMQSTAHIHRRETYQVPHGQNLGKQIFNRLKVPDILTKPAIAPPIGKRLDILAHLEPCKVEKIDILDIPKPLQPKVRNVFKCALEYMGETGYTKAGAPRKLKEPTILDNIKKNIKIEVMRRKIRELVEEDLHPYVFGCKLRNAVVSGSKKDEVRHTETIEPTDWRYRYFEEPQGTFLWRKKTFETNEEAQLRNDRIKEMMHRVNEQKRKRAEADALKENIEKSKRFTANNILNKRVRLGRIKETIIRLKKLENMMAKITGEGEEEEAKRKKIEEKMDRLRQSTAHDLTIETRKVMGSKFWMPLYTSSESDITIDDDKNLP